MPDQPAANSIAIPEAVLEATAQGAYEYYQPKVGIIGTWAKLCMSDKQHWRWIAEATIQAASKAFAAEQKKPDEREGFKPMSVPVDQFNGRVAAGDRWAANQR